MRNFYRLILSCLMLCAALEGQSQSSKTFTYTGAFEKYIVPTTGWYLLDASGAQGGANGDSSKMGGKGSRIQARMRLTAGDTLQIGVGGMGRKGKPQGFIDLGVGGGGGGGASSIVLLLGTNYAPLLFAGGGGGGNNDVDGYAEGTDRRIWQSDREKEEPQQCQGGSIWGSSNLVPGCGGGFCSGGKNTAYPGASGQGYLNGNAGGNMNEPGGGGWGGGGQGLASNTSTVGWGGGGGGYAGGGSTSSTPAGSGTSYIAYDAYTENTVQEMAVNSGNGSVTIKYEYQNDLPIFTYKFNDRRFRTYIVPRSEWYLLEATGGTGGRSADSTKSGGFGATIRGYMYLNKGDSLRISVGSSFPKKFVSSVSGGNGGGASSIVRVRNSAASNPVDRYEPLLFAAGGGGAANGSPGGKGMAVNTWMGRNYPAGTESDYDDPSLLTAYSKWGGSGSGFLRDGLKALGSFQDNRSLSYLNGYHANIDVVYNNLYLQGTFGGGGMGGYHLDKDDVSGGGGGGFTGGFGGDKDSKSGGGGGGSYWSPRMYLADSVLTDGGALNDPTSVRISIAIGYKPPVVSANEARLGYLGQNFQSYVAPGDGWYLVSAAGAEGGPSSNNKQGQNFPGGKGATMQSHVFLKKGDSLRIVVGGMGEKGKSEGNNVGGGGGGGGGGASIIAQVLSDGSFKPLVVAGGGGGGASAVNADMSDGSQLNNGDSNPGSINYTQDEKGDTDATGGSGGAGWTNNTETGFISYRWSATQAAIFTVPGSSFADGSLGGFGYQRPDGKCCGASRGGFGGGGAGGSATEKKGGGGGGGGGWSGGWGGDVESPGGGGTSFISRDSTSVFLSGQSGIRTGNGEVQIKYLSNWTPPGQKLFFYADKVFQNYIVPKTGWYLLDAIGARGGTIGDKKGGYGARMQGHAFLQAGDTLRIAVGGNGTTNPQNSAGGGGGSSIVRVRNSVATNLQDRYEPLVFAGGGGGSASNSDGGPGQIGPNGQGNRDARGGVNGGGGGIGSDRNGGAGGGGYLTDGGTHFRTDSGSSALAEGGKSYLGGNSGGANLFGYRIAGWGGGGEGGSTKDAQSQLGGGGGGGWSGGAGGSPSEAGGGGGSYLSPRLDLFDCQQLPGYNQVSSGGQTGQVIITYKPDFKPTGEITFQGDRFQKFIVPTTGWYLLDAGGAQGGPASNDSHAGGKGARMQGYARLKAGDTLRIAVGGMGQKGVNIGNNPSGGGGGGGSSILRVRNSAAANPGDRYEPLLFAGGGGGAGSGDDGSPGQVVKDGTNKRNASQGGVNGGGGGIGENKNGGAGGAGYRGDGGTHCDGDCNGSNVLSYGGQAYLSGNSGGGTFNQGGDGGFGGGGEGGLAQSTVDGGGGGGGGWSGGGGGWSIPNSLSSFGGSGGGSYSSPSLNVAGCLATEGAISGDGFVTVKYVPEFTDTTLATYGYKGSFETYIVPKTGVYFMEAKGAQGGPASNDSHRGGYGARMQGRISLTAGDTLRIAVGGMGKKGLNAGNNVSGGGGGGGTSIVKVRNSAAANPADRYELLLISAGGGGATAGYNGGQGNKDPITTSSVGGGIGPDKHGGAGGAGYSGDGGTHCDGNCNGSNVLAYGGQAYLSGNSGGATPYAGGDGGWGGGGEGGAATSNIFSNIDGGGGGGGGWSGGSDNRWDNGGGSYFASAVDTIGCLLASGANSGDGQVTIKFLEAGKYNYQSGSIQTYTVPVSGFYQLAASGAQGGSSGNGRGIQYEGGYGARMQGRMSLNAGDTLRIAVGGMGKKGANIGNNVSGGGGGGSSSIVKVRNSAAANPADRYIPLLFAGGGGGGSARQEGQAGQLTNDATLDWGGAKGGVNGGGGGIGPDKNGGSGGAGYKGDGGTHCDGNCNGNNVITYGGQAYLSGNSGGAYILVGGDGGWGGGGEGGAASSVSDYGGGGGGGWSGGAGSDKDGGGGGGSYVAAGIDTTGSLSNTKIPGEGLVTIRLIESNTFAYGATIPTIQEYTVPVSGFYQLTASGAQGGSSGFNQGGRGARMQGYVYLQANDKLRILVGGRGGDAESPTYSEFSNGGGGGGATSIVRVSGSSVEPLIFAGGGGGGSQDMVGGPGLTSPDGGASRTSAGGRNGFGGSANPRGFPSGGGGGGFLASGQSSQDSTGRCFAEGGGGYQTFNANVGGACSSINGGEFGGWGGGGQGGKAYPNMIFGGGGGSGGGGGGWSGGGSSQANLLTLPIGMGSGPAAGGGGGGSYLTPRAVTTGLTQTAGQHAGNGTAAIIGPRTSTETVRSPGTYTWPRNGVTYRSSGLYVWVDSVNAITRTLDLRITALLGGGFAGPAGGSLMAYPNPSDGLLTLRTPSLEVAAKLEIYSVDGRRVQEYEVPARTTRFHVDLRRHGAGVYVFRMVAEGEDEHIKVIVE